MSRITDSMTPSIGANKSLGGEMLDVYIKSLNVVQLVS
jgi:hypothetical protein